ncbi:hypothetical protein BJY01DRAFT_164346 [Aspergillus pseudoustus]|uniref:Zn(2)-C6 fungal-type domain-containing protein n=1 Tax=Aspergillus pseudoustus TaxID=1810923 RepID=A0ABR4K634_9EURO
MTPSPPSRSQSRSPRGTTGIGPLRSRRGCKTCKARRVKCGEEKPTCLRCSSTGRKCEYQGTVPLGTYSSAAASSVASLLDKPRSPSPNSSSSSLSSVWRERRAFAYYFQHAATFVGGLDVEFWSTVVPQVCQVEPAVWDAIIALSAMFEDREHNSNAPQRYTLPENRRDALAWYSRSVSAVRQRIERGGSDVFVGLISCVLFICIEALQGGTEEAIRLYAQGVQLIVALRAQIACGAIPARKGVLLEDTIVPIFVRLAIMALSVSGVSVQALMLETAQVLSGFASLKAAREAMVLLVMEAALFQEACESNHADMQYATDVPPELIARQAALFSRLRSWKAAFTTFLDYLRMKNGGGELSAQQTTTIALLTTYHEMTYTIVAICTSPRKTITDKHLHNFRNIVDQSRIALDASARSDGTQPPFTFDIGVGFPIWFTCLRCADPTIRREALALLRRAPQVEGFYGNATITVSAEAIMVIEESLAMAIDAHRARNQTLHTGGQVDTSHITMFDVNRFAVTLEGPNTNSNAITNTTLLPTLTVSDIPEEARIKPLVPFRPRDGVPPGLTRGAVERWGRAPDTWFLIFSRLDRDPVDGVWREIFDCVPAELES